MDLKAAGNRIHEFPAASLYQRSGMEVMMKIDNMTLGSRFSDMPMSAKSADPEAKNIRSKIADVQQRMRTLSSKGDLSADEKAMERKKLQKEILGLNNKLKQHEEDFRRSEKRSLLVKEQKGNQTKGKRGSDEAAGDDADQKTVSNKKTVSDHRLRENPKNPNAEKDSGRSGGLSILVGHNDIDRTRETDQKVTDQKVTDQKVTDQKVTDQKEAAGLSGKRAHALISANARVQQAGQVGRVILRSEDGIVILKGEIEQDERYGTPTDQKRDKLAKMNKRMQRAWDFQKSMWGQAHDALRSAAETSYKNETKDQKKSAGRNHILVSASGLELADDPASQQKIYVSID